MNQATGRQGRRPSIASPFEQPPSVYRKTTVVEVAVDKNDNNDLSQSCAELCKVAVLAGVRQFRAAPF